MCRLCAGNHVVRSEGLSVSPHGVLPLATNNNQFKPIGARSEALSCQPAGYNHLHHSRQQTNNHNTCRLPSHHAISDIKTAIIHW